MLVFNSCKSESGKRPIGIRRFKKGNGIFVMTRDGSLVLEEGEESIFIDDFLVKMFFARFQSIIYST